MVKEIRIHFEGDRRLRGSFHEFPGELIRSARQKKVRFELIAGAGHAVRDFIKALRTHPFSFNVLLLDCEGPAKYCSLGRLRQHAHWSPPRGMVVREDQVFRMVQLMESWFVADKQALASYFGKAFVSTRFPGNPKVEDIPKDDVLRGLKDATRNCQKGAYSKTTHAPELLLRIDPGLVKAACPNCRRLFEHLKEKLNG